MGIWILMLFVNLLIPGLMIGFGRWSLAGGPKEINWAIGYRTAMSMKNEETWAFAHREIGRLWTRWGWILLAAAIVVMLPLIGQDEEMIGTFGCMFMFAQLVPLIGCIVPVERKLRAVFDQDGKRRGNL